ncbi:MAG: hypothetical protein KC910_00430 [Candidatus Eremiobacteraeota bacterium]|nr:hypothetical protein [Candidatus Eremiobacteraeota bacterium]
MKNPLPVAIWLLSQDARIGALEERGFEKLPHPQADGFLYQRDQLVFHASGMWLLEQDYQLVYSRAGKRCYRTALGVYPTKIPADAERITLEHGFERFRPLLVAHEEWIIDRFGADYRTGLLAQMPSAEKRYAKNWKLHFSDCLRRQSARA